MVKYLLDTNIISEPFRLQPNSVVMEKLDTHGDEGAIASVTWHELLFGFHRMSTSRRKQQLEVYLFETLQPHIPILPYDEQAAQWFAEERARLTAIGKPPSYADGQIAAVASVNNLILVTRNVSDYETFTGIEIENWFE